MLILALTTLFRVILAAIFLASGTGKLLEFRKGRSGLEEFVPRLLVAPLSFGLPVLELAVSMLLSFTSTATFGAWLACGLLVVFATTLAFTLAGGRRPECHCFGEFHSAPISWSLVTRNLCLAFVSAWLATRPQARLGFGLDRFAAANPLGLINFVCLLFVAVATAWALLALLRQNGRLMLRVEALEKSGHSGTAALFPASARNSETPPGLPVGSPAPFFELENLQGVVQASNLLFHSARMSLLIFLDPECGPCKTLLPELATWQRQYADRLQIVVVTSQSAKKVREAFHTLEAQTVLLQNAREVAEQYIVRGTPAAVLISTDNRIASSVAPGADSIGRLVHQAMAELTSGKKLDKPLPPAMVRDLSSGKVVDWKILIHTKTMLLFWNPGCSFCVRLLPHLASMSHRLSSIGAHAVLVSRGSLSDHADIPKSFQVVTEEQFVLGRRLGVTGTPSAVLLGPDWSSKQRIAVGGEAILRTVEDWQSHESKGENFQTANWFPRESSTLAP